jgi:hypothetical protein
MEEILMSEPRPCINCRWAIPPGSGHGSFWMCDHPSSLWQAGPDLVTGEARPSTPIPCSEVRKWNEYSRPGGCGPEGKHWKPPDPVGFVDKDA